MQIGEFTFALFTKKTRYDHFARIYYQGEVKEYGNFIYSDHFDIAGAYLLIWLKCPESLSS